MPLEATPRRARGFKRRLLSWYREAARDLPWRRTRDPYAVLVSEFMLQQTQVSRVLNYYGPFLRQFPSVDRLARARPSAVREAWDGLGYYRRASNLHRLAQEVVKSHGGVVPRDPATLRMLPGVGAYTAGAVATFAYQRRHPAVDTNVRRVLGRVFWGRGKTPEKGGARGTHLLAQRLQPRSGKTAWEFNQALIELGALVCTARRPKCGRCPVGEICDWYANSGARAR